MKYARVAVEKAVYTFDKLFDYSIPDNMEALAQKGCRVTVPFGRTNKKCIGIIFEIADTTDNKSTKKIAEVLDESPLLNDEMLELAVWIKERTFCTLYEAAKAMLPTGINHRMVASYAINSECPSEILDLTKCKRKFMPISIKEAYSLKRIIFSMHWV